MVDKGKIIDKWVLTKAEYRCERDRLIGSLMDEWRASHVVAREVLADGCPALIKKLDALYAWGQR